MTQEEKQLLLKDLCARLPYGFTVHRYCDNSDHIFEPNEIDGFAHFLEYSEGEDFKPYLRPMSSMTEEENDTFNKLRAEVEDEGTFEADMLLYDWLNSHHFDYRLLIFAGLALEAPEGMYKTE